MVSGFWYNQDGLPIQYGTQKAIPEVGGDYLIYGETREIDQYIPLVPFQLTAAGQPVPGPAQTTFSGTTTPAAAGIQSLTTLMPLQITAPVITTTGGSLILSNQQVFIEEVTTEGLVSAAGGTSIAVGLVTTSPGSPSSSFVQVTPNAGVQLLNGLLTANMAAGFRSTFTQPGTTGLNWATGGATAIAGGGTWVGINMPLVTNAITPLPTSAWLSTVATGTFTNGLIKIRVRYTIYGNIPY
jgi:hypothetical protein